MPTVLRIKGYRLGFFSADADEPPHVHVSKAGSVAKFWLEPLQLAENAGFARHELNEVYDIVLHYRGQLAQAWHEYFR